MSDHSLTTILWDGPAPSPEIIAKVREDLVLSLEDLGSTRDLIFHVVHLDDDFEGPTVTLFAGEQENTFLGVYQAATEMEIIDVDSKVEIDGNRIKTVHMPAFLRRKPSP